MAIRYFSEDTDFKPSQPRKRISWIKSIIKKEHAELDSVNYIFCSDRFLLALNQEYLGHNTYTDIITFNTSSNAGKISGDIYISIDRVRENAKKYKAIENDELDRVMIHGILHLLGYKDKNPQEKAKMRKKEEACLSLRD